MVALAGPIASPIIRNALPFDDGTAALGKLVHGGPGGGQGITYNRLKPVLNAADDVYVSANTALKPDANDAKRAKNTVDAPDQDDVARVTQPVQPYESAPTKFFNAASVVMNPLNMVVGLASALPMVTHMGLPVVGWVADKVTGKTKIGDTLRAPHKYLDSHDLKGRLVPEGNPGKKLTMGNALNDGSIVAFNALGVYDVARDFSSQLDALKQMRADVTGQKVENISTFSVLTATNTTTAEKAARAHMLKEIGSRGFIQFGSLVYNFRHFKAHGALSMAGFLVPQLASSGIDMLMGDSCAPVYKGLADAHKQHADIPAQAYAEFLMIVSPEIKAHGRIGQQMALAIGTDMAKQHTAPGEILKMIDNGKLHTLIEKKLHEKKAPPPVPSSMVDRLNGKPQDRQVLGKFTGKVKADEMAAAASSNHQLGA